MRKSELEKLRTLNATPAMIRALQEPGTKRHYSGKINEEKYHLAARCQQLGGYLKVSICTREDISKKCIHRSGISSSTTRVMSISQGRGRRTEPTNGERPMGTIWKEATGTIKNGMSMYIFLQKVADRYRSSLEQKKKDLLVFASGRKDVKSAMRIKNKEADGSVG